MKRKRRIVHLSPLPRRAAGGRTGSGDVTAASSQPVPTSPLLPPRNVVMRIRTCMRVSENWTILFYRQRICMKSADSPDLRALFIAQLGDAPRSGHLPGPVGLAWPGLACRRFAYSTLLCSALASASASCLGLACVRPLAPSFSSIRSLSPGYLGPRRRESYFMNRHRTRGAVSLSPTVLFP